MAPSLVPILFVQALAIDPTANNLGIVFSNAGAVTVGIH